MNSTTLARTYAVALQGLNGKIVEVQTHVGPGLVGTTLVGLPDASLREAKERVRAAFSSCAIPSLSKRVTVNLSPADLPKAGSGFDLAIAVSMLIAREQMGIIAAADTVFAAELGLDGSLQAVPGALPIALAASENGFKRIVVAPAMASEAGLVEDVQIVACGHLRDLLAIFGTRGPEIMDALEGWELVEQETENRIFRSGETPGDPNPGGGASLITAAGDDADIVDVRGQAFAVEAMGIAAVGGHHSILLGPPGVGKTMLATRLRALLPDLSKRDSVEVTALRSLAGSDGAVDSLISRPPLEQPHHSATLASLIGGGNPIRPGSVSLAHAGVLVLDEAPEFSVRVLDSLRQPLESGTIAVHRARQRVVFPARFQLVMTANPCPCGGGVRAGEDRCRCTHAQRDRYWARISGPLLDRLDIRLLLERPDRTALTGGSTVDTASLRERTVAARARSERRWRGHPWRFNAQVPGRYLRERTGLARADARALEQATESGHISLRGVDRILRLAWSVADWENHQVPQSDDLARAFELRGQEERIR